MEQAQIELLVMESQMGDRESLDCLCRYFHPKLVQFAFKISQNTQIAEDAVQNSWLKIGQSLLRLDDPRGFKPWIYQMTRWQTIDLLRRQQREVLRNTDDDVDSIACQTNIENTSLIKMINKLPQLEREVIHLFYLEQFSLADISQILSIPSGTIKSRLYRARNILRKLME
ncbi:MAG: RNA polymerase sigma factor [Gammaproteobacteria bacterium]|nr:RNA polymerase sigma factor [Gammaproteobacteria bacterium]